MFRGGPTECPRKDCRTKFSKGYFNDQSSKGVWLILNVEVFSFSVNGCFKKVITYIYLQNGLPRPPFFFSQKEIGFYSLLHMEYEKT